MAAAIMKLLHNVPEEYPAELKKEILGAVGNLDHIEIWGEEVLVAPFTQPARSAGGIIVGNSQQTEDKWQSKSFLVLKLGMKAQKIAAGGSVYAPKPGDWCYGMPMEADYLSVRGAGAKVKMHKDNDGQSRPYREWEGWPCRLVLIGDIRGRTTRPQDVM